MDETTTLEQISQTWYDRVLVRLNEAIALDSEMPGWHRRTAAANHAAEMRERRNKGDKAR